MITLEISPNFTLEDIRMIRDYDYEMTKNMTCEELREYYRKGGEETRQAIARFRAERLAAQGQVIAQS